MAWADLEPQLRDVAERVCTRVELDLLTKLADGRSIREIARERGVTRQAVQNALRRIEQKIRREVAYQRGYDTGR